MTTIQQLKTQVREIKEEEELRLFLPLNIALFSYRNSIIHLTAGSAFNAVHDEVEQSLFLFLVT